MMRSAPSSDYLSIKAEETECNETDSGAIG